MTRQEAEEFIGYLRDCTLSQVEGVLVKEEAAERWEFAALALMELGRRAVNSRG